MDTPKPKTNTGFKGAPRAGAGAGNSRGGSGDRRPRSSFERPKPEFDQKMVSIRRVTRVVSGGRRMSFAVALAIGDKKGSLGLGTGKGGDTALAIAKALRAAKKNMFKIKTNKEMSLPHEVSAKFASSRLSIMPNRGKGLVAGSTVRDMLVLAGIKNVTAKINSGSKNKLNNARAAYAALYQLKTKGVVIPKVALTPAVTVE
jgi:small subunit ribosomal protein S5